MLIDSYPVEDVFARVPEVAARPTRFSQPWIPSRRMTTHRLRNETPFGTCSFPSACFLEGRKHQVGVTCAKLLPGAKPILILAVSLFCREFSPVILAFARSLGAERLSEQRFDSQQMVSSATSFLLRVENERWT